MQIKKPRRYTTTPEHGNKLVFVAVAGLYYHIFLHIARTNVQKWRKILWDIKTREKFKEVVHTIKGAEKDKDKFCKAARIERKPMSDERFKFLCYFVAGMVAMVMGFVAIYMVIYFAGR